MLLVLVRDEQEADTLTVSGALFVLQTLVICALQEIYNFSCVDVEYRGRGEMRLGQTDRQIVSRTMRPPVQPPDIVLKMRSMCLSKS